ncbi:YcgL domain-containing protein [Fontimonas sp. SYSU GA230001]|uniref:YcgL domain-containing protein n=1 Tax=Fontimonas sp. SYSU GA230001 TaxID=3142450 RepID=UPI0032B4B3CE
MSSEIPPPAPIDCQVYRCSRQHEMYVYLRADLTTEHLPAELLQRTGRLSPVMALTLHPRRRLARADVGTVIERLRAVGWYLQLPPRDGVDAHLHFGD